METSPSAIAFRGIRNVDMIPFIRDVIDTLREFDLRRLGSSKVYKTRMETELQPHLVPHWVQPLQRPPHAPFFHTRIQKWKRHNMMRVLEAAADEIAGDDIKIAEVTDALLRRVEPMGPHLQAAVDSFIQRLRLNRASADGVNGAVLGAEAVQTPARVKAELGPQSITTEEIRGRGMPPMMKMVDDCLSSNSSLKRVAPGPAESAPPKRHCVWDLSSTKNGTSAAFGNSAESVGKKTAGAPTTPEQCFRFEVPVVDPQAILAFLTAGPKAGATLALPPVRNPPASRPSRHFDLEQQYELLSSLDALLGPIPKGDAPPRHDDDASESHSGSASQVLHEFDVSNGVSERAVPFLEADEPCLDDIEFDEYQEAVYAAASSRAGDREGRELLEDARLLLQSVLKLGECPHVGALRVALVAEKLLPIVEQMRGRGQVMEAEELYALECLSGLLVGARERVQCAIQEDADDILTEIDSNTAIHEEVAKLDKLVDVLLALSGTAVVEEPRVQLRLASAHNRLASSLSQHGWVDEAQAEMDCANAILSALRTSSAGPKRRALSPPPECPISMEKMQDPVVLTTGHTFERSAIERWLNAGNTTCPITRQPLSTLELVPNEALRGYSARWHAENGLAQPQAPTWPELTVEMPAKDAAPRWKSRGLFQVDDFLDDVLKGAGNLARGNSFDVFRFDEAVSGKTGEKHMSEEGCQCGAQVVPMDLSTWNVDMMQWAVST